MIRVHFQPAGQPAVDVEIPDGRELAVLQRAGERVFPGPFDPMEEAGSEARFQEVMRQRKVPHGTKKRRAA